MKKVWIQDYMEEILIPDKNQNSSELEMKVYSFDRTA